MIERKMDIACAGTYRKYITFEDVNEMNVVVREYVDQIKSMKIRTDLKQALIDLLKKLKEYSCVYPGVSYRTKNNWSETFNVAYKTIERRLDRLEEMGFIQIINCKRPSNMNQTSNIVRILKPITENEKSLYDMVPGEEDQDEIVDPIFADAVNYEYDMTNENMLSLFAEMPVDEEVSDKLDEKCLTIKTSSSLKQNIKDLKERITKAPSKLLNFVPKVFKNAVSILNTADKNIYELWKVVKQVNKHYSLDKETLKTLAIDGFNILKGLLKDSYKDGKETIKNMFGKFNKIMHNVINDYLETLIDEEGTRFEMPANAYNWLEPNEDQSNVVIKREMPFYNWLEPNEDQETNNTSNGIYNWLEPNKPVLQTTNNTFYNWLEV